MPEEYAPYGWSSRNQCCFCQKCGVLVEDREIHDKWHEGYENVVEGARYGMRNRPIGGGPH